MYLNVLILISPLINFDILQLYFYLWSVIGVMYFGENDPVHFGTLDIAMLTLWRMATGDDWTEIMYTAMWGCDSSKGGIQSEFNVR